MSRLLTAGISGTLLALSVIASAAPKGGGETDPSLPALLEPFVHYRVTYFSLPEEGATNILLRDVNKDGLAVGRYETPDGYRRAVLADSDGNIEDLNGVFNKALAAYPGWRFDAAYCINANGQVAGTLVPNEQARSSTSPDVMIIRGDLYADPSSITVVDRVFETGVSSIRDMNEAGDMLVSLAPYGGEGMHWLYRSPEYLAEQIEGPEGAEDFSVGYLNGAGQISMVAFLTSAIILIANDMKTGGRTMFSLENLMDPFPTILAMALEAGGFARFQKTASSTIHQMVPLLLNQPKVLFINWMTKRVGSRSVHKWGLSTLAFPKKQGTEERL